MLCKSIVFDQYWNQMLHKYYTERVIPQELKEY